MAKYKIRREETCTPTHFSTGISGQKIKYFDHINIQKNPKGAMHINETHKDYFGYSNRTFADVLGKQPFG